MRAAIELLAQHRVFRQQVLGDALTISGHPSCEGEQQELQRQTRHNPDRSASRAGQKIV
jgi:hypothetical protein